MNNNASEVLVAAVIMFLLAAGFWGTIAYVAWHFIAKFW